MSPTIDEKPAVILDERIRESYGIMRKDRAKSSIEPAGIRLRSSNACSSAAARRSIGAASNAFRSSGMAQPSSTPGSLLRFKSSVKVDRRYDRRVEADSFGSGLGVVVLSNLFGSEIRNGYARRFSQRVFQGRSMAQDVVPS